MEPSDFFLPTVAVILSTIGLMGILEAKVWVASFSSH